MFRFLWNFARVKYPTRRVPETKNYWNPTIIRDVTAIWKLEVLPIRAALQRKIKGKQQKPKGFQPKNLIQMFFLPKITNNCRIPIIFGLKHQSCLVLHDYKVFETTKTLYFVFSVIFVQFWTTFPQQNVWYLKLPKLKIHLKSRIIVGFQ